MFNFHGALRIYKPAKPPTGPIAATEGEDNEPESRKPGDPYLARLVLLVPSEVLALYLTFKETASSFLGTWAAICLALVIFVRTVGTHKAGKSIQLGSVLIATISFVLWIYATGGYLLSWKLPSNYPGVISIAIGVWTFVIPYWYKGDSTEG
jgi:hypothetical protein